MIGRSLEPNIFKLFEEVVDYLCSRSRVLSKEMLWSRIGTRLLAIPLVAQHRPTTTRELY